MAKQDNLKIFERDTTLTPSKLRLIGYIPATIYGPSVEPLCAQIKAHEFELALKRGVKHFTLEGLGQTLDAEVKQLQKHNTKGTVLHVEFFVSTPGQQKAKSQGKSQGEKAQAQPVAETQPQPSEASSAEETERVEEAVPAH